MTDKPDVAYDPERVGEPSQPGVPTGDQRPTNEGDEARDIAADVHVPGPYPSDSGVDHTGGTHSSEPEPTKETRDAGSLGDVVHGSSPHVPGEARPPAQTHAGGAVYDSEDESGTPQEKIDRARAESFPDGVPEDADKGTGRKKGQGLPPGSVGRGEDTPQTPAT